MSFSMTVDDGGLGFFLRVSWVNVFGNILKIIVEGSIGVFFGSVALTADALHSLADLLASLVVLVWGRLSFMGADETHPHGHGRIENLTALFVGGVIVALSIVLIRDSLFKILYGSETVYSIFLIFGLGFAVIDMGVVYWYTKKVNGFLDSPSLKALEEDCLNDIYTSIATGLGVVGLAFGQPLFDPIAGGLVALIVLYRGVKIGRENINYLVGSAPPIEKQNEIIDIIKSHPDVRGVHDFTAHYIGPEIEVEMHIEIDYNYTLREAHDIETEIINRVKEISDVGDVHIHLDPSGIGEWKEENS